MGSRNCGAGACSYESFDAHRSLVVTSVQIAICGWHRLVSKKLSMQKTQNPPVPPSPVVSLTFATSDSFGEFLRHAQGEIMQTEAGDGLWKMLIADLAGTAIQHGRSGAGAIGRGLSSPSHLTFLIPWLRLKPHFYQGLQMQPGNLAIYGPGVEFFGHSASAHDFTVVPVDLQTADVIARSLLNEDGAHLMRGFQAVPLRPERVQKLVRILEEIELLASQVPHPDMTDETLRVIRDSLLDTLFLGWLEQLSHKVERLPTLSERAIKIRAIEDYLMDHRRQNVTQGELCAVAKASARTLAYIFNELVGMPPLRFLKLRRMHRARWLLRSRVFASVKSVALECGFWEFGRFSIEYRRLFGESPSQTIHDSRTGI